MITPYFLAALALTALNLSAEKPVQVYILSAQSNMVGIGQVGPIGTTGNSSLEVDGTVMYRDVPGEDKEFKDNVRTVETRDFWPDPKQSPKSQGFHYHQNAGTYMQIGEAMGAAMVELQKQN